MLTAVVAVLLSSTAADAVASAGRIRAGVSVGGLELGGRRIDEAERLLIDRAKKLASTAARFRAAGKTVSVTPEEVGFYPDVDETLARAERVGRDGHLPAKMWQRVRSYFADSDLGWSSDVDGKAAAKIVAAWAERFDDPGHEAGIKAQGAQIVAVNPTPGRQLDRDAAARTIVQGLEGWPRRTLALPFERRGRRTDAADAQAAAEAGNRMISATITLSSPVGTLELHPAELAKMLEAVPVRRGRSWRLQVRFSPGLVREQLGPRMKPFEREPRDASFAVSGDGVAVRPGEDGLEFDAAKTAQALDAVASLPAPRSTDAAFTARSPSLTTEEAQKLNIHELVSTFTSKHPAGQPRVKNIHLIADLVDGTVVKPGDVFSLNRKAGERTADKGYVLAPMIFDGEYKDEVGGGVSQFATTIYNTVLVGGYKVEAKKAHSYYISRYPPGRDATISWPAPDFKFRNDSGSGILIKTSYTATSITVSFYGDKDRTVDLKTDERTNVKAPEEKRVPDPAVPAGQERVKQAGSDGFDILVWRTLTFEGGGSRKEKIFTRYLPEPRIILVGQGTPGASPLPGGATPGPTAQTTPAPTPKPTPTPSPRGGPLP